VPSSSRFGKDKLERKREATRRWRQKRARVERALEHDTPETLGARLAVALVQIDPPSETRQGRPWTPIGWLDHETGIGRTKLYMWLNDEVEPRLENVRILAKALKVSAGWLAFGTGSPTLKP
jgi:hypothetical protein